jgi:hypothetical protein
MSNTQLELIENLYVWATTNDHFEVVQYLNENTPEGSSITYRYSHPKTEDLDDDQNRLEQTNQILHPPFYTFGKVCKYGRVDLLELFTDIDTYDSEQFSLAIKYGHLNILEWWDAKGYPFPEESLDWACRSGHLHIVKWLHQHRDEKCSTFAMDWASEGGYLDIVEYLNENTIEGCTVRAMDWASENGHLEVVQYLNEHTLGGCSADAMYMASRNGHQEIVRYLQNNVKENFAEIATEWACSSGKDIPKFLWSLLE